MRVVYESLWRVYYVDTVGKNTKKVKEYCKSVEKNRNGLMMIFEKMATFKKL